LLDYLPIIDDTVYGVTDAYTLPLTHARRPDITGLVHNSTKFLEVAGLTEGVHSIHLVLKSISNLSMPLDYLFKVLHASKDVPLIGRGNRYRAHGDVEGKVAFNGLTCWFDAGAWLTATFYRDGHVEVIFQCPETVMVPLGSLAAILRPVNRFIRCVNNTLRWGTTLECDLRVEGTYRNTEGFPFFESIEQCLVRNMSYMYATDFITSRDIAPTSPLHEVLKRVSKCPPSIITSATSTILRVDQLTTLAALRPLRAYAAAYMYELWVSDTHSYTFRQPRKVRLQASADEDSQEYPWNLPRMTHSTPTLVVLRGTQVGPPNLASPLEDKLPASLEQYLGSKFYLYKTSSAASPFLQCMATHLSLTSRPITVEGIKSLIVEKAKTVFPLYQNLVLQFSTNMTSSVRNHTPFVNFKNYIESEETIDFTFVWDVCSRIFNANLVIFNGDNPVSGKVEVIAPCSETLDLSRETVLLLKHNGTFDLISGFERTTAGMVEGLSIYITTTSQQVVIINNYNI
jgi:hypothetical protein